MNKEIPAPHLWNSLSEFDERIAKLRNATMLIHVWGLIDREQSKDILNKIERWAKERKAMMSKYPNRRPWRFPAKWKHQDRVKEFEARIKELEAGFSLLAKDEEILPHFKNADDAMEYYIELAKKENNDE